MAEVTELKVDIRVEPYGNGLFAARLYVKRPGVSTESHMLLGITDTKAKAIELIVLFGGTTVNACFKATEKYGKHTYHSERELSKQ